MGTPSHNTRKNGGESGASLGKGVGLVVVVERTGRKSVRESAGNASPGDASEVALLGEDAENIKGIARVKFKGVLRNRYYINEGYLLQEVLTKSKSQMIFV